MGEIVNLRKVRKSREREAAVKDAAEQRALHGRTLAERDRERAEAEKLRRILDGSKQEP